MNRIFRIIKHNISHCDTYLQAYNMISGVCCYLVTLSHASLPGLESAKYLRMIELWNFILSLPHAGIPGVNQPIDLAGTGH